MSWLSTAWRQFKRGRTDAEVVFSTVAAALASEQREQLRRGLASVEYAVNVAGIRSRDPRIAEAREWVSCALRILGDQR